MNTTRVLTTAGVGAAIIAGSMLAVNAANAHGNIADSEARVSEFAERFDLNEDEVKSYFEEKREQRQNEREEQHAEHLSSLVADGSITQQQADALSAKKDEMRDAREALHGQDLTKEEMHERMQQAREDFNTWADEQGIDLDSIRPERADRDSKGHGKHHKESSEIDS